MDRIWDFLLFVCAIVATGTLLLATFQAYNEKYGSAGALGAIFVVCALFVFIPRLEYLKVWAVEARLTQTLDRAEETIAKIKELSASSARANYMLMAWGNRLATARAKERQAVMDQIDKQLSDLEIASDQRARIAGPFVRMIGFDWHTWFSRMLVRYVMGKRWVLLREMNTNHNEETKKRTKSSTISYLLGKAWTFLYSICSTLIILAMNWSASSLLTC